LGIMVATWRIRLDDSSLAAMRAVATINLYVAIGGYFTPRRTFYPVALKPLRIVAVVTFPEYMYARKR